MDVTGSLVSGGLLQYVKEHDSGTTFVAIDAPLIISNPEGQRRCETLVGNCYGGRHASCHTSNLSLYPQAASVTLASQLIKLGFRHAPLARSEDQRVMLEVYPHPALLELFALPSILRHKKGNVATRRGGQRELQKMLSELSRFAPPLERTPRLSGFLATNTNALRGTALKSSEDALDALLCAYIAYYYWFWGLARTRLFGDPNSGYILVPTCTQQSAS